MTDAAVLEHIRSRYAAQAQRYADFVFDPANQQPLTSAMITAFGESVHGRVLDAGCGNGQWTAWLRERGVAAEGIDLAAEHLAIGRARFADLDLDLSVGSLLDLPAADGAYGGVLAHFSLIHLPPHDVPAALGELARVLADGGLLCLAGFGAADDEGPWVVHDHKICTAYRWTPDALAAAVRDAGLVETARLVVAPPPGGRFPAVYLFAAKMVG